MTNLVLVLLQTSNVGRCDALARAIERYGPHLRLSPSAYLIKTNDEFDRVYEALSSHVDASDRLFVLPIEAPFAGADATVTNWLEESGRKH